LPNQLQKEISLLFSSLLERHQNTLTAEKKRVIRQRVARFRPALDPRPGRTALVDLGNVGKILLKHAQSGLRDRLRATD
jgi:hypothetical protein